jgi:hypothetical protein
LYGCGVKLCNQPREGRDAASANRPTGQQAKAVLGWGHGTSWASWAGSRQATIDYCKRQAQTNNAKNWSRIFVVYYYYFNLIDIQ